MYSLIIIDDEKVFIKNMCEVIDFKQLDMTLAATASNGVEGYKKIAGLLPDIIICDIEMPQMGGFEMLEKVKEIPNYSPQIIMFTAFDDFNYAKKAISFKVIEYLVKPCLPDEVISALKAAKAICDKTRMNRSENFLYSNAKTMLFINNIIHNNSYSSAELLKHQNELGIDLKSDKYCLLRLYCSADEKTEAINIRLAGNMLANELGEAFKTGYHTSFNSHHLYFLVLGLNSIKEIIDICRITLDKHKEEKLRIFISVSDFCSEISQLPELLNQVKYCAKFSFCFDKSQVLAYSAVKTYVDLNFKSDNFIKLENNIRKKTLMSPDIYKQFVRSVEEFANAFEYYDPDYFKSLIYHTIVSLITDFVSSGKTVSVETKSTLWRNISECANISDLIALCRSVMIKFQSKYNLSLDAKYSIISDNIKTYVQNNYMNTISSSEIAKQFYMSDRRLRDIFTHVNSMSINDYIHTFRMQKAFELLKTTRLSIQEIGKSVGYNNQLRFRQAFTDFYGKPPSEFQKK